jgi:hypothetical protein
MRRPRGYAHPVADPKTEELSTDQVSREAIERERARHAEPGAEERTHRRRADKHAYLKQKLEERKAAEER